MALVLQEPCSTTVESRRFGVIDESNADHYPAYVDVGDETLWMLTVINRSQNLVAKFYAIDHCVNFTEIPRDSDSLCDCALVKGRGLYLIEIKDRRRRGWLGKASDQLKNTVAMIRATREAVQFDHITCVVSNVARPNINHSFIKSIQDFKDEVGLKLEVTTHLSINGGEDP